jgi:outer membrane protein assembly factor BamD (BamD/ComL family)
MKIFAILLILLIVACGVPQEKYNSLELQTEALKRQTDSLMALVEELQKTPATLLAEAKTKIKAEEYKEAKNTLTRVFVIKTSTKQNAEAVKLFRTAETGLETIAYVNISNSMNVDDLKSFITRYPKSRYASKIKSHIKKYTSYQTSSIPISSYSSSAPVYHEKKIKSSSQRVGAICNDGTRSYATGRGACSHHGGVREWLYD